MCCAVDETLRQFLPENGLSSSLGMKLGIFPTYFKFQYPMMIAIPKVGKADDISSVLVI